MASQKSDKPDTPTQDPANPSATKPPRETSRECVNPLVNRPLPKTAKRKWNLPALWMNDWIETATRTGSVLSACEAARVSMVDVNDARRDVPEFDDACRLYEQIADLLIQEIVRQYALAGNANGLRYYFQVMRDRVTGLMPEDDDLSPEVAATLIRNALEAHGDSLDPLDD